MSILIAPNVADKVDVPVEIDLDHALPPVEEGDSLKAVIDNVSVGPGLPVTGRKATMQGTLGPSLRVSGAGSSP
ncbi:hypothetical protein C8Q77DRAFT_1151897 [Trametes polyzona]|nr:hypothetical protein C8Q77DRAFT_1151897 [Trametes polyzona]